MKVCANCKDNIEIQGGWYEIKLWPPHRDEEKHYDIVRYFCTWRCMSEWVN